MQNLVQEKDTTMSYLKQIIVLATPIIIENILQTLLGTVDTYFAGQLNDNAIAAIGVTSLIMNIFISFYTAISIGASTVISRFVGRNDIEKANNTVKLSVILGCILGVVIGIVSFILCEPILKISGAESDILGYAIPYYMIVAVPSIFLCLSLVLSSCLRAAKDTKTPMIVTGFSNILNIILNYVFIKLGWGIVGLALATTISRMCVVIILAVKLMKSKGVIKLSFGNFSFDKDIVKSVISIGIPAGIEKLIMRIGQLIYNGFIISIGTTAYVAHNVGGTIEFYSYIPAFGIGMATATLVGISLGENNPEKAKKFMFLSNVLTTVCMVCIGAVFYFFAPSLAALFTSTPEVQETVVSVLRLIAFFQPAIAISQIMASGLQGAGDTKFPMYTTFLGTWIIHIGLGYILGIVLEMGLLGIWLAYALNNVVRAILLVIRYMRGKWQSISI